jgi:nucleoside-diphosphate-sugar epimerase
VTPEARIITVTGASGVVGRHLCDHFRRAGWRVHALMRNPAAYPFTQPGIERFRLELPDVLDADALDGARVVVHAAYATRSHQAMRKSVVNQLGTEFVLSRARQAGVPRFVFVSSLSAHRDARSFYGRSKLQLEACLDPSRDVAVRAGLVLAPDGGLGVRLWRTVARTRVAPVFGGGNQVVQTIHVDDLCAGFERLIESGQTGVVHMAEPDGLSMRRFLSLLAGAVGVRALLLPVPAMPTLAVLRALEAARVPLPVSRDNLLGLLTMRHVSTASDAARIGMTIRPAHVSIRDLAPMVFPGGGR